MVMFLFEVTARVDVRVDVPGWRSGLAFGVSEGRCPGRSYSFFGSVSQSMSRSA